MVCEDCGAGAPINEEQSNENWKVYKNKCDKCGGKIEPKLE